MWSITLRGCGYRKYISGGSNNSIHFNALGPFNTGHIVTKVNPMRWRAHIGKEGDLPLHFWRRGEALLLSMSVLFFIPPLSNLFL